MVKYDCYNMNRPSRRVLILFVLLLAVAWPGFRTSGAQEEPPADTSEATGELDTEAADEPDTEAPVEPEAEELTAADGGLVITGKIDGEIGFAESAYVKRLLEAATLKDAEVLLIELNTFGGRVDAAVAIRDALLDAEMTTVVYINRRAISAGALISLACEKIAMADGGTIGAATPIQSGPGQEIPAAVEEKYLSYFREEMRSTAESRGRDADIAEAMVDKSKVVEGLSEEGKLLTLTTKAALETGIADIEAESLEDVLGKLGLAGPTEKLERSWSEGLVSFLTSAPIASLLFLGMMILGYLEYQTPGFGFFGFGALFCFLLLYFGHFMVNLAGWEEVLIFSLGVALILVEIFVIPGFGVIGIAGILAILTSVVMLLMAGDWTDFTFTNPFTAEALLQVALSIVVALVSVLLMIKMLPRSRSATLGGHLFLDGGLTTSAGYTSHEETTDSLVGEEGTALNGLRPTGKAKIAGRRWNVETQGDYIDAGETVRVIQLKAGRIVVRRV